MQNKRDLADHGGVFLYPKWTNAPGIFVHIMARIQR